MENTLWAQAWEPEIRSPGPCQWQWVWQSSCNSSLGRWGAGASPRDESCLQSLAGFINRPYLSEERIKVLDEGSWHELRDQGSHIHLPTLMCMHPYMHRHYTCINTIHTRASYIYRYLKKKNSSVSQNLNLKAKALKMLEGGRRKILQDAGRHSRTFWRTPVE